MSKVQSLLPEEARNVNFEDTILATPLPQACSTVNKKSERLLEESTGGAEELLGVRLSFLKGGMDDLALVRNRLSKAETALEDIQEPSLASLSMTSSHFLSQDTDLEDLKNKDTSYLLSLLSENRDPGGGGDNDGTAMAVRQMARLTLNKSEAEGIRSTFLTSDSKLSLPGSEKSVAESEGFILPLDLSQQDVSWHSSNVVNLSQIDRDEEECQREYGDLPMEPRDRSLSGISTSQLSVSCMPRDESLLRYLGPMDPPRAARWADKPQFPTGDIIALNETVTLSGKEALPGDSRRWSMAEDQDLETSIPSISAIAEALKEAPSKAMPRLLMDRVLNAGSTVKNKTVSLNSRSCVTNPNGDRLYDVTCVVGCVTEQALSSVEGNCEVVSFNPTKLRARITRSNSKLSVVIVTLDEGEDTVVVKERFGEQSVSHKFKVLSELPKVVVSPSEVDFGLLGEKCNDIKPVILRSCNSAPLVLNHRVVQGQGYFDLVNDSEYASCKEIVLRPYEEVKKFLLASPLPLEKGEVEREVVGMVELGVVGCGWRSAGQLRLRVNVGRVVLQIAGRGDWDTPLSANAAPRPLPLVNASPHLTLCLRLRATPPFSVTPTSITIPPKANPPPSVYISFHPTSKAQSPQGDLFIQVLPDGELMHLPLKGTLDSSCSSSPSSSASTRPGHFSDTRSETSEGSSRSSSPYTSTVKGSLELDCTCTHFVWGGVRLGTRISKTCCFRNRSNHREKLLFTIHDPTNSFMFLNGEVLCKEMKVSLDSMQKKEVAVVLCPSTLGQLTGEVRITRVNDPSPVAPKKSMRLFGFGGRSELHVDGVKVDVEKGQSRLLMDTMDMSKDLYVHNRGDCAAFFIITQPIVEGTFSMVRPDKGLVEAGEKMKVSVEMRPNIAAIEELLRSSPGQELKVTSVIMTHGDLPTLQRLARLHEKLKCKTVEEKLKPIKRHLEEMVTLVPRKPAHSVTQLKDPHSSLLWLYKDGVRSWSIDVEIGRENLEGALLDSSQQFLCLENTIADETGVELSGLQTPLTRKNLILYSQPK